MGLRQMHIAMYILCFTRGSAFPTNKGAGGWPNTPSPLFPRDGPRLRIQTYTSMRSTPVEGEGEYNYEMREKFEIILRAL